MNSRPLCIALLPIVLVTLAACGGGSQAPTATTTVDSPLDEAIYAYTWSKEDLADQQARINKVENLVADCMVAEAFEYVPTDVVATGATWDEAFEGSGTGQWIAQNGYGIALHYAWQGGLSSLSARSDYVDTLSDSQVEAYEFALWGADDAWPTYEQDEAGIEGDWERQGCMGAAQHEVEAPDVDSVNDKFDDLLDAMRKLAQSRLEDPRMVEVSARWADCMADAGYPGYAVPDDVHTALSETFNGLASAGRPTDTQLADFRELEITTAMADFTCQETTGWATTSQAVQFELETAFVKDYKADIDQYVAAVQAIQEATR